MTTPLIQSLTDIKAWFQANYSTAYAALRPGMELDRFQSLMADLPVTPPAELAALYGWHDGQTPEGIFFAYYSFYPLAAARDEYLQNRDVSQQLEREHGFVSWRPSFWPVLGFEGEYFVLDSANGSIWYYFLEDDPYYAFDSLAQFCACIASAMKQGLVAALPDGRLGLDGQGFETLRRGMVSAAGVASRLALENERLA